MSRALAGVEWIEQKSIKADRNTLLVTFGVNDKNKFSLSALTAALPGRYRGGVTVVDGP